MEEQLIQFVKKNEFLYNKRCRSYKNICLRNKKFEELSVKLKVPAKKLKERWRTLKDKFYREIKKYKCPSGSGAISSQKKWKWLDQLMFLDSPDFANENTSGNFPNDVLFDEQFLEGNVQPKVEEPSTFEDFPSTSTQCERPSTSASTDSYRFNERVKTPTPRRGKKEAAIEEMLKDARVEMSEMVSLAKETFAQTEQTKTVAQHFFEGLAKQVDEANLSMAQFLELQIQTLQVFNQLMFNR